MAAFLWHWYDPSACIMVCSNPNFQYIHDIHDPYTWIVSHPTLNILDSHQFWPTGVSVRDARICSPQHRECTKQWKSLRSVRESQSAAAEIRNLWLSKYCCTIAPISPIQDGQWSEMMRVMVQQHLSIHGSPYLDYEKELQL